MRDFYQAYLESQHARFVTPKNLVFEMTRRATSQTPVSRRKIVEGCDKEVYFVATAEGAEFVALINQTDESFAGEVWSLSEARKVGVPVPEVLLFDALEHEGNSFEFMVQTKTSGHDLATLLPQLSGEQKRDAIRQMGEVLSQIHAVKVGGFYKRDASGVWDFPSWSKLTAANLRDRAERELILRAFTETDFDFILRMIELYANEFDCAAPVLCHGDYTPEHIYFNEDLRACGVIDFGDYQGNHPVHDFAILRLWENESFERAMREGYADSALFDAGFELRLHLHFLAVKIGFLAYHIRIPNHPDTPLFVEKLKSTIKWLRENVS